MFLKARSIFALRPPTPNAAHNLNSLADLARKQGRPADAIALDTEALDIFRKSLLKDDTIFKRAAAGLARHLEEAGDYAAAAELWRELLAIWRDLPSRFPNDQPLVMAALGVDLERLGNFEEASTLCAAAYDDYASRGETQLAQTTVEKLVHLYEAWDAAAPGEGHAAAGWRPRASSCAACLPRATRPPSRCASRASRRSWPRRSIRCNRADRTGRRR
jgi:tetratricopeptide (TPR) repeat protein